MPVLAAAKLVQALVEQVQPEEEDNLFMLTNFCRVACTVPEGEVVLRQRGHRYTPRRRISYSVGAKDSWQVTSRTEHLQ